MHKRLKFSVFILLSVTLMAATVPLAIWITHTSGAKLENARRRCERYEHPSHKVFIQNDAVSPAETHAHKCDTLIITNNDHQDRLMAFGKHDSHVSYDGVSEKLLRPGQSLRVTLITAGTYIFHDHADDSVKGTFTVSN